MGNINSFEYQYSVEVEKPTTTGYTGVRRCSTHPDELIDGLTDVDVNSCWQIFKRGCDANPKGNCLGKRAVDGDGNLGGFEWLSFEEVEDKALRVGSALMDLDLVPTVETPDELYKEAQSMKLLGVFAKNRVEWFICEQAANAFGLTLVPLYDTLGDEAVRYILDQTQLPCVAASLDCVPDLLKAASGRPYLKAIVVFDPVSAEDIERAKQQGITLYPFSTLEAWKTKREPTPGNRRTVGTLCYTSGTTGNPKGVLLTQGNFIACVCGILRGPLGASQRLDVTSSDIHISYLPLAHVFERMICNVVSTLGAAIGVYSGDTMKLLDDIRELKPTIFISVPRLFSRINDKIFSGIRQKSAIAQYLFHTGMETKLKRLRSSATVHHRLWDSLVFHNTKNLMGGHVRYMLAGGAPIDALIQDRMKVLFGAPLLEGYGLTETLGASFIASPYDPLSGHVGGPIPAIEFCLASVPEMDHDVNASPPSGEILVRGPVLFQGYFRNPEETKNAFDENGWLHSGDIAVLLPNGGLKIIDRRKNIFKLAQGEYVAPEKIESVYIQASLVAQVFAFGYSSKYVLVGIVVPDEETAQAWAKRHNKGDMDLGVLCKDQEFKAAVHADMEAAAKEGRLKGFEKLKDFYLHPSPFTTENGLLTPTLKLKRHQARQFFDAQIDSMYAKQR